MKKNKIKTTKYESNDTKEIKNLIIITIIVILVAVLLYILTNHINNKKELSTTEFNYDTCLVGNMFDRPYDEYYVFLYSQTDTNSVEYKGLITSYMEKEDALKIYYVDMNNKFNSEYLKETSNKNPQNSTEVMIKESALVKIKDGKVSNYYEKLEDYKKVLEK